MLHATLLTCATLLAPSFAEDPKPAAPKFDCMVVLSADVSFEDRWYHTSSQKPVNVEATSQVVRGQDFRVLVLFRQAASDAGGQLDVRTDITILRPDGKPYHSVEDLAAYRGPSGGGNVLLASKLLGVSFDPKDALGAYQVRVVVRDVVGKASAKGEASIELVERIDTAGFEGEDPLEAASEWAMSVQAPREPQRLLAAFEVLAGGEALGEGDEGSPLRAFFRAAFDAHPYLYAPLGALAAAEGKPPAVRDEALRLIATGRAPAARRLDLQPEALRKACAAYAGKATFDPAQDALAEPGQIDELWGTFFATNSFAVFERVTQLLELEPKPGTPDMVLHGAARWSLDSIAEQHEVAHAYASWIAGRDTTPEKRRKALRELLDD